MVCPGSAGATPMSVPARPSRRAAAVSGAGAGPVPAGSSWSVTVTSAIEPRRVCRERVCTESTREIRETSWPSCSSAKLVSSPRGR